MNAKFWDKINRSNWVFIILVLTALLIVALFFLKEVMETKVRENREKISEVIKKELGFPVNFESIEPGWSGFSLGVFLKNIVVFDSETPVPFISIGALEIFPNIKDLLVGEDVRFSKMVLQDLKMVMAWNAKKGASVLDLSGKSIPTSLEYTTLVDFIQQQKKIVIKNSEITWHLPDTIIKQSINGNLNWVGSKKADWFLTGNQEFWVRDDFIIKRSDFKLSSESSGQKFSLKTNFGKLSALCNASKDEEWNFNCEAQGGNINIALLQQHYVLKDTDPKLLQWLSNTLPTGVITKLALKAHGLMDSIYYSGEIDYRALDFQYGKDWPKIKNARGMIKISTERISVQLLEGKILGEPIETLTALVDRGKAPVVHLEGSLDGTLRGGMLFLDRSPLRHSIKQYLEPINPLGLMHLKLKLAIPLDEKPVKVDGLLSMREAQLTIPDANITVDKVKGDFHFTEREVEAKNIEGLLLGESLRLEIKMGALDSKESLFALRAEGMLDPAVFQKSLDSALLERFSGKSPFVLSLETSLISGDFRENALWMFDSTLQGIAINLPPPLEKAAEEVRPLKLKISGESTDRRLIELHMGSVLSTKLVTTPLGNGFKIKYGNLVLGLGEINRGLNETLIIDGNIKTLKVDDWVDFYHQIDSGEQSILPLYFDFRLFVDRLEAFGTEFKEMSIATNTPSHSSWMIESPYIMGEIIFPEEKTEPLQLKLDYLKVTDALKSTKSSEKLMSDVNRPIYFSCKQLHYRDKNLGEVLFELNNKPYGYEIKNATLGTDIFELSGSGEWHTQEDNPYTTLQGSVIGINMGEMFTRFGYPSAIQESSGYFKYDFKWKGDPFDFNIQQVKGVADLKFDKGRILGVDPGLGRIMGLLNIESIKRRLQLDFSDVLKEGFVFDIMQGTLAFKEGITKTDDLFIDGPSAKIELQGESNLRKKTIDLDMTVTPHVSTGLPIAAAIAVGNPALGAGIWIFDKLTGSKITKITAHEYRVTGTWSTPIIKDAKSNPKKDQAKSK